MEKLHFKNPREIKKVVLDTDRFTVEEFIAVVRYGAIVEFSPAYIELVNKSRKLVERFLKEDRAVYGVTTGFGDNVSKRISPKDAAQLQMNIVRSHAVSVGQPLSLEEARAIQMVQLTNTGRGFSGVSIELLEHIRDLLNNWVVPCVPGEGVVGGLSVEGHTALVLIGEGKAYYKGELMSGADALKAAGLKPYHMKEKEGLSLLNGSTSATALSTLACYNSIIAEKTQEVLAAMSYETNKGNRKALDPRLMSVKDHSEQQETAVNILKMLETSEVADKYEGYRLQDAYSLRCVAQMSAGSKRIFKESLIAVDEELNSCSDNPIIYPDEDWEDGIALMGGNFDRSYLGLHMDASCVAMTHIGKLAERRTDRLTNRHFSEYPPFLVKNPGLNSGFMITQYTSAGLLAEMKVLSHPASVDTTPTSANQEDPIIFGYYAGKKAYDVSKKLNNLLAIEMMTQVQAMDFMNEGLKLSEVTKAVYDRVRKEVPPVDEDRAFYLDIVEIEKLISSGEIVEIAENIIGELSF